MVFSKNITLNRTNNFEAFTHIDMNNVYRNAACKSPEEIQAYFRQFNDCSQNV